MKGISVIIPYHSNQTGLTAVLMNLQSQIVTPDRIIIIDTSKDKSGLSIATRYSTNNIPILVECAQVGIYEAWNKGITLAEDHDVLIINDDVLLPQDAIYSFTLAREKVSSYCYVPETPNREHASNKITVDFDWYNVYPNDKGDYEKTAWMPGFCFYLTREAIEKVGLFDTRFKVWYGDTDYEVRLLQHKDITKIKTLYVYHYGNSSYDYENEEVSNQVRGDYTVFQNKYQLINNGSTN